MEEYSKTSNSCKSHSSYSNICRSLATYILIAWSLPGIKFSNEFCNVSKVCRNLNRYLFFAKNLRRYLTFARIMQHVFFNLQESCKISIFCLNLQDLCYLEASREISNFCKDFARYLFFVRILQVIFTWQNLVRHLFLQIYSKCFFSPSILQVI